MTGRDPSDPVEEVRAANDVVSVIGAYVRLRKAGRSFKGLCPFHKEKTPSFMVNPERQTFHCFGCGKGGDVFRFLMEIEGVRFPEALRTLAQRAGIRLPERGDPKKRERRERLSDLLEFAHREFCSHLKGPEGRGARALLEKRGIGAETIERFGLGFTPDAWRALRDRAHREGYTDRDLLDAGLIVPREKGDPYDRFRGRLLFPIRTVGGRVIGFGGRIVGEGEPKYLNSPETDLFRKGEALYGLDKSRSEIRREGSAVLVEGYTDLIALDQEGIRNVVAPLGTALTSAQARLLANYTDRVVLLFDGDDAGMQAALRSLPTLAAEGLRPAVADLPKGSDPDDYVRSQGAEKLRHLIAEATDLVPFLLDQIYAGRKEEGIRALIEVLAAVRDELRLALLLQEAAQRTGVAEDVLYREVSRRRKEDAGPSREAIRQGPAAPKRMVEAERGIAFLGLEHPELLPVIRRAVDPDRVEDLPARKLLKALYDCDERGEAPPSSLLTTTGVDGDFSRIGVERPETTDPLPALRDYIACVRTDGIQRRIRRIQEELKDAEDRNDWDACTRLLEERTALAQKVRRIMGSIREDAAGTANFSSAERSDSTR